MKMLLREKMFQVKQQGIRGLLQQKWAPESTRNWWAETGGGLWVIIRVAIGDKLPRGKSFQKKKKKGVHEEKQTWGMAISFKQPRSRRVWGGAEERSLAKWEVENIKNIDGGSRGVEGAGKLKKWHT